MFSAYSELVELAGEIGNFKAKVRQKPRYIDASKGDRLRRMLGKMSD